MSRIKYYTYTQIKGEESERLLVELKPLIRSKKITDFLPQDTKLELTKIESKLEDLNSNLKDIDSQLDMLINIDGKDLILSGGTY